MASYIPIFPVGSTNIFPIVNSTTGGQLLTEFNIRALDSVMTDSNVQYRIGPSYVHSAIDFYVFSASTANSASEDGISTSNVTMSSSIINISSGRAIINGHYFETLLPVAIDIAEYNANLPEGTEKLSGKLCIGLRAVYSGDSMAGTTSTADSSSTIGTLSVAGETTTTVCDAVQIVIAKESEFKLPSDTPDMEESVTAHILLAKFRYFNGTVTNVVNNYPAKCVMIDSLRVGNITSSFGDTYVKKLNLNPAKYYTFAGTSTENNTDDWCDSTGSLMVWDSDPLLLDNSVSPQVNPNIALPSAKFAVNSDSGISLKIPHKQMDGLKDSDGNSLYYAPIELSIPTADFVKQTPGIVTSTYTSNIKNITTRINELYNVPNGKQRGYLESIDSVSDLPAIDGSWNIGDYIIVGEDKTITISSDAVNYPATMYIILPGYVIDIAPVKTYADKSSDDPTGMIYVDSYDFAGTCLAKYPENSKDISTTKPNLSDPNIYYKYWYIGKANAYRGEGKIGNVYYDYFVYEYIDSTTREQKLQYYVVTATTSYAYIDNPIRLTGEYKYATTTKVGGFLNVDSSSTSNVDRGYVSLDENGHLKLIDYDILRTGTLAYQLGSDITISASLDSTAVQEYLDDYVNQRIAFPVNTVTDSTLKSAIASSYIDITFTLNDEGTEENPVVINIHDIESRFNTSVYVHIKGTASQYTFINFYNIDKLRIDSSIASDVDCSPTISLYNCGIYYDSMVLDQIAYIKNMTLWYERYNVSEPSLTVDGMTVRCLAPPVISNTIDFQSTTSVSSDSHFKVALNGITFNSNGDITGVSLYVANCMTASSDTTFEGKTIFSDDFTIPTNGDLTYPETKLIYPVSVTGEFIAAYAPNTTTTNSSGYVIMNTSFTAVSQTYSTTTNTSTTGHISFLVDTDFCEESYYINNGSAFSNEIIPGWETNTFHVFSGFNNTPV